LFKSQVVSFLQPLHDMGKAFLLNHLLMS